MPTRDPSLDASPARAVPGDALDGLGALLRRAASIAGSHAAAGLVGVLSLPLLARALGPADYGRLSLFLTLLGVVTYQDFLRPLFVRAFAGPTRDERALRALSTCVSWSLGLAAAAASALIFEPTVAALFAVAVLAHGLASVDWARLALDGRVARAALVRNLAWGAAVLVAAGAASTQSDPSLAAVTAPFCGANLAILVAYRLLAGAPARHEPDAGLWTSARRAWGAHRATIGGLVGFGLANALVVSADRLVAQRFLDAHAFGLYSGCADLAAKLALFGTAIGTVLYPAFTREAARGAPDAARFTSLASRVLLGWGAVVAVLVAASGALVTLVLGPGFAAGAWISAALFASSFVHMAGFLVTPWQRARGEFGAQTKSYAIAGALMLVVGVLLVPALGIAGVVLCACTARTAEIVLVCREVRWLPRGTVGAARLAAFGLIAMGLAVLAAWQAWGGA